MGFHKGGLGEGYPPAPQPPWAPSWRQVIWHQSFITRQIRKYAWVGGVGGWRVTLLPKWAGKKTKRITQKLCY